MRQVPFSTYTGGTWDDVVASCEYWPEGASIEQHAPCIDTVTHLDCAGRRVTRGCYLHPGDLIVIVTDGDPASGIVGNNETILWMDYVGELVQLMKGK